MGKRDFEALTRRRLKAAALFAQGKTQADVARRLRVSRMTASRWERAWMGAGKEALQGAGRAGRKPRVSDAQRDALATALRAGPQQHGYATELWTLPRIAEVIRKLTGVRYHPGHVWRVMRGLGWSLQRPTTRARERDAKAIATWVRTTWATVKKTPSAAARPSSSRTRAGSRSARRSAAPGRRGGTRRS